ncbi:MAG TPA: hypothetical protein VL175_13115 [Pirellulales bacterium]|jgi:hypothetical protein|nr:hypothetical protein [Pirellulales bacterium]
MPRRFLLAVLAVLMAGTSLVADDNLDVVKLTVTPAGPPHPRLRYRFAPEARQLAEGNAAAMYYRAIVMFQQDDRERKTSQQVIDWLDLPLAELPRDAARKMISRYSGVLDEVRLAARRKTTEWDLPLKEGGVATLLPEIQEIRELARLMALDVRLAILEGDFAAVSRKLESMYTMGRQVGESGTLVSMLVGVAVRRMASTEVGHWIAHSGSPNAYWALTCLPGSMGYLAGGIESEDLWIQGSIPYANLLGAAVLTPRQLEHLAHEVGSLMDSQWTNGGFNVEFSSGETRDVRVPAGVALLPLVLRAYPACKRQLLESDIAPELIEAMQPTQVVVLRWVQVYRELLDEMVIWARHAPMEMRRALAQIDDRFEDLARRPEAVLAKLMLPAMSAASRAVIRGDQRIAMLRVVEALRLYAAAHEGRLPAALDRITEVPVALDPVSGRSFDYRLNGDTAVITSAEKGIVNPDTQLEITVGR